MTEFKKMCFQCKKEFFCDGKCKRSVLRENKYSCICRECGEKHQKKHDDSHFNYENYGCQNGVKKEVVQFT